MIPVKYNLRSLRVRWVTTLMTVTAILIVVWVTVLTFGLADGLEHALQVGADPLDVIALRKGSTNETSSGIDQQVAREIATLEGIATDANGERLSSIEFLTILTKPRRGDGGTTNLIVRGLDEVGRKLRSGFQIVEGRDLKPGLNELITSRRMAERFENLAIGEALEINQVDFQVVGYFEAGGSAAESEVWAARGDLTGARRQAGAVTSVTLRARDEAAMESLIQRLEENEQFNLKAVDEVAYYEEQTVTAVAVKYFGFFLATFLACGAMFAAANTMYSAVASRSREIGTMRALGFRRRSILTSFLFESTVLCLMGGILGCIATLPLNGLSTGTLNWATFSEITFSFRFGPEVLLRGVLMALVMGLVGGLFPAVQAVRLPIISALREQ
jgi:putative ABC transport system permease protein